MCNGYAGAISTTGSSPTVVQNRTFRWLPVRTVDEEVRAACAPSEIVQLYAALPNERSFKNTPSRRSAG
jgi:hypothetical protein